MGLDLRLVLRPSRLLRSLGLKKKSKKVSQYFSTVASGDRSLLFLLAPPFVGGLYETGNFENRTFFVHHKIQTVLWQHAVLRNSLV